MDKRCTAEQDASILRVAVIDDDYGERVHLARLLDESGMAELVGAFADPSEALDRQGRLKVDAVFLDIDMPGVNGAAVVNRLHSLDERIGVVFVSGHGANALEAFEAGALDYLLKPVSFARMQKTLWFIAEHAGYAGSRRGNGRTGAMTDMQSWLQADGCQDKGRPIGFFVAASARIFEKIRVFAPFLRPMACRMPAFDGGF